MLLMETDRQKYPAGIYECPKCSAWVEVFVPLNELPTHPCGAGKRSKQMEYRGLKRDTKIRNSIG